ncbi:MAG TPA: LanC-like protein [Casimicrobiaceae bacterium]|jgi:hypothetical protein|nr:LanC-like protein [Casimicrobiaceae bacterium]
MLFDPARHERLLDAPWDEGRARAAIARIVSDTEARFSRGSWPLHPNDADGSDNAPQYSMYFGAAGVVWALRHLERAGAAPVTGRYDTWLEAIGERNRAQVSALDMPTAASYLFGETPILMMQYAIDREPSIATSLHALIEGNKDHPSRELMWGAPGTLLAAVFMHEHTGDARWAHLFRESARTLWSQLEWSAAYECHYWTQHLYGSRTNYLDAVHGFVGTALPLIRGRALLDASEWAAWAHCIANTVRRTATHDDGMVNWRAFLEPPTQRARRMLMQYCHGAPGFVVCLAGYPGDDLDDLLTAAGEATWAAGPLAKGSNLCHGTGGNGYAFLKLFDRTGDERWLDRARRFAMHGIAQTDAAARAHGAMRYSLWTGDPGFAVYLWDCIRGGAAFPTLDVFFDD